MSMKNYIDPVTNQVWAFAADGSQDAYIPANLLAAGVATPAQVAAALAPTAAQLWAAYQASAQGALTESDKTILRCAENQVAVPATWATYRKALRAVVGAASGVPGALPSIPAYPAGT